MARPHALAALVVWMAALFVIERVMPLRVPRRALLRRLWVNFGISALAYATAWLAVRPAVTAALGWSEEQPLGLVHLAAGPTPARWLLAFLLLDLSFYWWHRANHALPFLWRFHNVHHIDPDLDVSTAFRFHFGEVALSSVFRAVQVAAIGASAPMFATYELVFQAATFFHHSNLRLPLRLDRGLSLLAVTPRMHGIHHSQVREETNANYSVVFSWWDRLHRTLRLDVPQEKIAIGVPGYARPEDNTLASALLLPFRRQRPYWPAS